MVPIYIFSNLFIKKQQIFDTANAGQDSYNRVIIEINIFFCYWFTYNIIVITIG